MSNAEQIAYWNGEAGQRWAAFDATMERLLRPISEALMTHAAVGASRSALDIGCGGGSQTLLLARQLGTGSRILGVDISQPLLAVARQKVAGPSGDRAAIDFLHADAATHDFAGCSFDLLFSRFGVMFFDDPVAAFGNLRSALQTGGRLAFTCWQPPGENAWTALPLRAAQRHLPPLEPQDPHAPGPFAFADPARVRDILQRSGFAGIEVTPLRLTLRFGEAPTLAESVRQLVQIGPIARLLAEQDAATLAQVLAAVEEDVAPHYADGALNLAGAIWMVTARAG
jgi:SAM-dependent methyltransferase